MLTPHQVLHSTLPWRQVTAADFLHTGMLYCMHVSMQGLIYQTPEITYVMDIHAEDVEDFVPAILVMGEFVNGELVNEKLMEVVNENTPWEFTD